jgi:DNA-binding transcriptional MerR regulator
MDEYLTTTDTARVLRVSTDSVRLYERKGLLPAIRTRSGVRLFLHADVMAFLEKKQAATPEAAYAQTC